MVSVDDIALRVLYCTAVATLLQIYLGKMTLSCGQCCSVGVAAIPRPGGFNYSHNSGIKARRGLIKYI